jgi:hypothetical protein
VADFYFEINDRVTARTGGKYFTTSKDTTEKFPGQSKRLLQYSDRAWCEQEGAVWFIKHRMDPTTEVDMKEFMWIKLKSQTVKGR